MEQNIINDELDVYFSAIGYDLAEKECHLNLLVTSDEKKYFRILVRMIPNISNVDIISVCNLSTLLATFKRLNEYISKVDENMELFLKLISKRNDTVTKIDKILTSFGFTAVSRNKLKLTYDINDGNIEDING
ncbi:hypothetical protein [Clostridium perfringens]|uniref:hypothetical protein n=1 Tax=Clostridium perfringens TaxID=1502 RepID=UPI000BB58101|nr:hypothetical protein [Clostridium perfringens]ATD49826.1 hypothetical protein CMR01_13855 [Clostridium perfringens]MBI6111436.1 hypothetical protein [Clostridium perfringens]MBI6114642.1 hypothetical protein [Clostridium perfringens]MDK0791519.1 hypothetical protein [Clostridium perfringens]MDM0615681.1 hypothetical protein [Clostridium perfringens]